MQFVFLFFAVTAGIAAGIGVNKYAPELPVAWLAGALVFVIGVLLREKVSRRRNEARNQRRLALLHRLHVDTRDEVTSVEMELQRLRELMESGAPVERMASPATLEIEPPGGRVEPERMSDTPDVPDEPSGRDSAALVAEAKVLRGLVGQLDAAQAAGVEDDRPNAAPDSKANPALAFIRKALRQNRLDLFLRPIVALPQRKRRFHQCAIHLRGREGETLPPERYGDTARAAGLGAAVDKMLLFRAVQLVRGLPLRKSGTAFFCGVAPDSFADERFLADFVSYLGAGNDLSPYLVFEIAESDRAKFDSGGARELESLVRAGYRLCLTRIEDFEPDVPRLVEQGFRFLKIDARRLMSATRSNVESNRVRRLKQALDRSGLDMIVDNIRSEQMLVELLDFNIDFGAGLLFGEPRQAGGEPEPAMAEQTGAM